MARVADVLLGVVVGDAHVEHGAAGQPQRMGQRVHGLPGEVPVADPEEPLLRAVGQGGEALDVLADVMGVRVDGENVGLHGQRVFVGHDEVGRVGGMSMAPSCSSWISIGKRVGARSVK